MWLWKQRNCWPRKKRHDFYTKTRLCLKEHKRISQDKCLGCIYVYSTILGFHLLPCGGNGKGGSSEDTLLHWPILYTYRIFFFVLYSPRIAFANCGHKLCKLYLIWNKKTCCVVLLLCSLSKKCPKIASQLAQMYMDLGWNVILEVKAIYSNIRGHLATD